jgi:hypothetical protein
MQKIEIFLNNYRASNCRDRPRVHFKAYRLICAQIYYMKLSNGLSNGLKLTILKFVERLLHEVNQYLLYFSEGYSKQMDHIAIIEILNKFKAPAWHDLMATIRIETLKLLIKILEKIKCTSVLVTLRVSHKNK